MDLRQLRYFVAVAEERHFTRAAERLGIRQPPLSLQIQQLEREIGTPLFRRLSRGVELTEAGQMFLEEARTILAQLDRATRDAQRLARGESGRIRLGFAGATYFHPVVLRAVHAYRTRYPEVRVSPEQSNTPTLLSGLLEGRIDVAFVRPPLDAGTRLRVEAFIIEELVIALPVGHILEGEGPLPLAALASEALILFPRAIGPGLHDTIISACHDAGFNPTLRQDAPQIVSAIPMVAAGFGISIVPRSVGQIRVEGATCREIAGTVPRAPISLAYRRDDRSAALAHFITVAGETARDAMPQ